MQMTYQVVGEKGKDPTFQNKVWGAVMAMARDIMAAPQDSGTIMDDATPQNDLTQLSSKNQAKRFAKLIHLSTDRTLANLVLLNPTIAADPDAATDSDLQYQVKQVWMTFVEIG
jgi:hypothetical protein